MVYWKKINSFPTGLIVSVLIFLELLVVVGGWKYKDNLMSSSTLNISNVKYSPIRFSNVHRLHFIFSN